jgi:hypothetical protein
MFLGAYFENLYSPLMRPLSPIAPTTNRGIARYGPLHGNRLGSVFPFRTRVLADALITDQEVAILCDVLEGVGANLNANKRKVLDQPFAKGFVVAAGQEPPVKYKLTAKAQQLLAERGVGLSGG